MPNWIEGTLKIRGEESNIRAFIENALKPCAGRYENDPDHFVRKLDYEGYSISADTYVDETNRMFVADDCELYFYEDEFYYFIPIKQAWGFQKEDFVQISKKYNLDLRITGFEKGMEFAEEIEVIQGLCTIDRVIEYSDYRWECPCPTLGG